MIIKVASQRKIDIKALQACVSCSVVDPNLPGQLGSGNIVPDPDPIFDKKLGNFVFDAQKSHSLRNSKTASQVLYCSSIKLSNIKISSFYG
jgi:hypothetical protein